MGNTIDKTLEYEIESSIVAFRKCDDDYRIYLDPTPELGSNGSYFVLEHIHPNFDILKNKIILGITYKFKYKILKIKGLLNDKVKIFIILNIEDRTVQHIENVEYYGRGGIEAKYKGIHNKFIELYIDRPGRFLIQPKIKKGYILDRKIRYDISYVKFYRADFYLIIDLKPTIIEEI